MSNEMDIVKHSGPTGSPSDFTTFVNGLGDFTPRKGCKLCQSKFRDEAHAKWDHSKTIQLVFTLLRDKGEDISYNSVRTHIQNHYVVHQSDESLKELADRLQKWDHLDISNEVLLTRYIKLLNMEAMALLAQGPELPLIERRKNQELVIKLFAQIDAFEERLRTQRQKYEPVEIVWKTLNRLVEIKISSSTNPEIRRVLNEIMEQMSREVGDMPVDGYIPEE